MNKERTDRPLKKTTLEKQAPITKQFPMIATHGDRRIGKVTPERKSFD